MQYRCVTGRHSAAVSHSDKGGSTSRRTYLGLGGGIRLKERRGSNVFKSVYAGSVNSNRIWVKFGRSILSYVNAHRVGFSIWRHIFKMAAMTSLHAEMWSHLVNAHNASVRRIYSSIRQFLIHSTFVLLSCRPARLCTSFSSVSGVLLTSVNARENRPEKKLMPWTLVIPYSPH